MAKNKKNKKDSKDKKENNKEKVSLKDTEKEEKRGIESWAIIIVLSLILAYAFITHFYDLGYRAYHHDEGIHAYYSWNIAKGGPGTYKYDPVYHGPFLYFANAFCYRLWGGIRNAVGTDYNARVVPSLFGIFLLFLFYSLKHFFDTRTAIFITLLGAVSPTLTYFARFIRHDIYITVYMMGIIICFLYYWREKNLDYIYFAFALLALSFVTKEDTYIMLFILFSFAFFYHLIELSLNTLYEEKKMSLYLSKPVSYVVKEKGKVFLSIAIIFLKIITLNRLEEFLVKSSEEERTPFYSFKRIINDIKKFPVPFLNAIFIFVVIYAVFFTSFFTNPRGLFTGMFGFFSYWVFDQQLAPRIPGAFYYYLSKLIIYEFTICLFAFTGVAYLLWKRDRVAPLIFYSSFILIYVYSFFMRIYSVMTEKYILYPACAIGFFYVMWGIFRMILYMKEKDNFISFIIYWSLSSLYIYSYAQEKVPWLMVPIVLPITVLAGLCIGKIFREGKKITKYITALILLILVPYNIYVSYRVNFVLPDDPIEPMVFTQTTRDLVDSTNRIVEIINKLEEKGDKSYIVYVDNEVSWPTVWYLKDYTVSYALPDNIADAEKAVVIMAPVEKKHSIDPLVAGKFSVETLKLRAWWLADNVRFFYLLKNDPAEFFRVLYRFLFFREVWNSTGSTDFLFYVRKDFSDLPAVESNINPEEIHEIEERPINLTPTIANPSSVIGSYGMGRGQFMYPRGVDVDGEGNIYVVDSYNHRIEKFSPDGKFILAWGKEGEDKACFQQPCGLAVDKKNGYVFVADTWNQRIQRFSTEGEFHLSWGEGFYGPRDIVIDEEGNLYVSDTGNCLIRKYSPSGEMLTYFGSKGTYNGELREPIGLAINKEGNLVIADTWNQRVQIFNPEGNFLHKFDVSGWYGEAIKEPYIAIDKDNNIILTDSAQKKILIYSPEGELKAVWSVDFSPLGIVLRENDGKLIVTDLEKHNVKLFDWKF